MVYKILSLNDRLGEKFNSGVNDMQFELEFRLPKKNTNDGAGISSSSNMGKLDHLKSEGYDVGHGIHLDPFSFIHTLGDLPSVQPLGEIIAMEGNGLQFPMDGNFSGKESDFFGLPSDEIEDGEREVHVVSNAFMDFMDLGSFSDTHPLGYLPMPAIIEERGVITPPITQGGDEEDMWGDTESQDTTTSATEPEQDGSGSFCIFDMDGF